MNELLPYLRHLDTCDKRGGLNRDCTCGLWEIVGDLPVKIKEGYRETPGGPWIEGPSLKDQQEGGRFVPAD